MLEEREEKIEPVRKEEKSPANILEAIIIKDLK